jgi:ABC-type microcin C transport system duplicated ATPase subunit YejF
MSFVLIEHDLDIALRVVERVTVMHNGRVLKHRTPTRSRATPRCRRSTWEASTDGRVPARSEAPRRRTPRGPLLAVEGLDVYYGRAHALQG